MTPYMAALRETVEWREEVKRVKNGRPVIPAHDPASDNTEEWKAKSAMLQGFNLCLTLFGEKTDD